MERRLKACAIEDKTVVVDVASYRSVSRNPFVSRSWHPSRGRRSQILIEGAGGIKCREMVRNFFQLYLGGSGECFCRDLFIISFSGSAKNAFTGI